MRLFLGIVISFLLVVPPLASAAGLTREAIQGRVTAQVARNITSASGQNCTNFTQMLTILDKGGKVSYACMDKAAEEVSRISDQKVRTRYVNLWNQKDYGMILRNILGNSERVIVADYIDYTLYQNFGGGIVKFKDGTWTTTTDAGCTDRSVEEYLLNYSAAENHAVYNPGCYYVAMMQMQAFIEQNPDNKDALDHYKGVILYGKELFERERSRNLSDRKWMYLLQSVLTDRAWWILARQELGQLTKNMSDHSFPLESYNRGNKVDRRNFPAGNGDLVGNRNNSNAGSGKVSGDGSKGAVSTVTFASGKVRVRTN